MKIKDFKVNWFTAYSILAYKLTGGERGRGISMQLELDRITKQYKNKIAVDRLSAVLKEGVHALLGANGAGKTTLMRMICGILESSSGEIRLDGGEIISMGERYRDLLGYLPQDFGYYPNFTAMEFMLYIASLKGLDRRYAKEQSASILKKVGLADEMRHKIKTFSGGMRQRLGIAQAVLNDPKILVLDEPTAGLDPKERVRFRNMIAELGKERIVLLSTHIVSDIEAIADQIFLMKQGQFIAQGTLDELQEHYQALTHDAGAAGFSLEKLYLYYFAEENEYDTV